MGKPGDLVAVARDDLFHRIARSRRSVELISPFLTAEIATGLAGQARAGAPSTRRLLTALDERSVTAGALDPSALRVLLDADWEVATIPNLHAKLSLVDRSWGLLGSGNLTSAGLGGRGSRRGNVELGVVLTNRQVREASRFFDDWWGQARPVTKDDLPPYETLFRTALGDGRRLPVLGKPIPLPPSDTLARRTYGRAWIKAMYHDKRQDQPDWWFDRTWLNDRHVESNGRYLRMPSYAVGDLLALYLVEPRAVPAIYRVTGVPELRKDFVRAIDGPADAERYGWVTPVDMIAGKRLQDAPLLSEFGLDGRSLQNGRKIIEKPGVVRRILRTLGA